MPRKPSQSPKSLWAYAYLIVPSQSKSRVNMIKAIVDRENTAAVSAARIWTGRLVQERRITHVLVVSDSPEQDRGINRRLEAELKRMKAEFFLTKPMTIPGHLEIPLAPDPASGNGHGMLVRDPSTA